MNFNKRIGGWIALLIGITVIMFIVIVLKINNNNHAQDAGANIETETTDSLTVNAKTMLIVKAFEFGKFDAITNYFDQTMKKALPAKRLQAVWKQLIAANGKFVKAQTEDYEITLVGEYQTVEIPFSFQKEVRLLRLVFNQRGEISGLFFQ